MKEEDEAQLVRGGRRTGKGMRGGWSCGRVEKGQRREKSGDLW